MRFFVTGPPRRDNARSFHPDEGDRDRGVLVVGEADDSDEPAMGFDVADEPPLRAIRKSAQPVDGLLEGRGS